MKIRVADYIANFLSSKNIDTVFTVTGGGAMHLNDALGHHPKLKCVYNHNEQACSIAAEGYFRVENKLATVCVTTGPGGTNAITGVMGAWVDSIPMFVLSGQFRYDFIARSSGPNCRAVGDQEFDITRSISCMTKYAEMVVEKNDIAYHLEKALFLALSGRPGPVWLDIPLNIQSAIINTEELKHFSADYDENISIENQTIDTVADKIVGSKRPLLYVGSAVRTSGSTNKLLTLAEKFNVPVVLAWNSVDAFPSNHSLYVGRAGLLGDRPANFAVANSDLIVSLGCRLSVRQVGYNKGEWAPNAFKIMCDIDEAELKKKTIDIDFPVLGDVGEFINALLKRDIKYETDTKEWIDFCSTLRKKYPIIQDKFHNSKEVNPYIFVDKLSALLCDDAVTVVGNGTACVVGSQAYNIKCNQRFIINSGAASMGYDLPASIGAAEGNAGNEIICITGDGSIQMNLQELQTIKHHNYPIKIFVINNGGYHSIRQTQKNFFNPPLVGVGVESKDLSFPSLKKLSNAYGFKYFSCDTNNNIDEFLKSLLKRKGPLIAEIFVDVNQNFEPKAAAKKMPDGSMVSRPMHDMYPFLSEAELKENIL